jgi:hypothetical protein
MELQGDSRLAPDGSVHEPVPGRSDLVVDYTDNVARMHDFIRRHPHVSFLSPRLNGGGEFLAVWIEASGRPGEDGTAMRATHERLGNLMNYMEAHFGDRRP